MLQKSQDYNFYRYLSEFLRLGSILEAKFGDDPVAVDIVYGMLLNRPRRNL